MLRSEALEAMYPDLASCAVVTIMGATASELYALGHRPNFFYLEHAMGLASSMGLGIALSRPEETVVVLDGDGSIPEILLLTSTDDRDSPNDSALLVNPAKPSLMIVGLPILGTLY